MSTVDFEDIFLDQKENLFLVSTPKLCAVARDPELFTKYRLAALGELAVRYILSQSADLEPLFREVIGEPEFIQFKIFLNNNLGFASSGQALPELLWRSADEFSQKCQIEIRARLQSLFLETDGFIPIYSTADESQGYFVPFQLQETAQAGRIFDATGQTIAEFQEFYPQIFGAGQNWNCRVNCRQVSTLVGFKGPSFMFPVWLAAERKLKHLNYDPLRLVATGEIRAGHIYPVKYLPKLAALKKVFHNGYLLCPQSSQKIFEDQQLLLLPNQLPLNQVQTLLDPLIERENLWIPNLGDALQHLTTLSREINNDNLNWEHTLKRLKNLQSNISPTLEPEKYLMTMMLNSTICCHLGQTAEALQLNSAARNFAERHREYCDLSYAILRMQIDQLVMRWDLEDFEQLLPTQDLLQQVENSGNLDLQMRLYGTLGQINAAGAIIQNPHFSQERALTYCQRAIACAKQLNSPPDIAQDLNYLHLWYALFAPESPEENKLYRDAKRYHCVNLPTSCKEKNLNFLCRQKNLARYRHYLMTGQIGDTGFAQDILFPNCYPWQHRLLHKYHGTLWAAHGQFVQAEQCFKRAVQSLDPGPILQKITLNCYGEALNSLRQFSNWDQKFFQTGFDQLAQQIAPYFPDLVPQWQKFLAGESTVHPGLQYWY